MDYKSSILQCLEKLRGAAPEDGDLRSKYTELIEHTKAENDERKLFVMWQSLREVMAEQAVDIAPDEAVQDTSFKVKTKEGKIVEYKTLDHMAKDGSVV